MIILRILLTSCNLEAYPVTCEVWEKNRLSGSKSGPTPPILCAKKSGNQSLPDLCTKHVQNQKKKRGLWMVIVFHWFNLLNSKTCLVSLVICTQIKRGHVPSVFPKFSCTNSDNHPFPSNLPITKPHMESPPICFCRTTCSKRSRTREAPIPAKISTNSEALMLKKGTPASPKRGLRGVVRCNPWNDGLEPGGFGIRIGVWVGTPSVPMPIPFIRGSQNIHNHPRERCQLSICWSWKRDGNKMGTVTTTKRWRGCNYCHRIQSFGQNTKKKRRKRSRESRS